MVTIIKGDRSLSVPLGAYRNVYASAGWEIVDNQPTKDTQSPKSEPKKVEEPIPEPELEEDLEEELDEDEEDVEYVDPEELLEKPLEELDFEELKIAAEYLNINTKGMKSSKALREAIKKSRKH